MKRGCYFNCTNHLDVVFAHAPLSRTILPNEGVSPELKRQLAAMAMSQPDGQLAALAITRADSRLTSCAVKPTR